MELFQNVPKMLAGMAFMIPGLVGTVWVSARSKGTPVFLAPGE